MSSCSSASRSRESQRFLSPYTLLIVIAHPPFLTSLTQPHALCKMQRQKEAPTLKKCRITVMRVAEYRDLMARYENPMEHPCGLREGQVFLANGWEKPEGLCQSAWDTMSPFVLALSHGGQGFYGGWMKDPRSVMLSCNDGFRPVSFLVEALEEDAD